MTLIHEFAPAKLNLYLHITGRRSDGYHDLDSLVAFATIGDELRLAPADSFSFALEGPQASTLINEDHAHNLAVAAAHSLAELTGNTLNVALTLVKNLPVASGIGGGSSDAAAALRALARHWGMAPDDARLAQAAARHGQDVPVCLRTTENNYMTATGVIPAPRLPRIPVVLVNPNKGLSTPSVYKEYKTGGDAFSPLARLDQTPTTITELVAALHQRGNDLYAPAVRLMPEIATIITALNATDCLLSRMSGSGATCFGLYPDDATAQAAASSLRTTHPTWWITSGALNT